MVGETTSGGGRLELETALYRINAQRALGSVPEEAPRLPVPARELVDRARTRLAIYGTLAPGEPNHEVVRPLGGTWERAVVRGRLYPAGWGASFGAPALVWDPAGEEVPVHLLDSAALARAWPSLDRFEGHEYLRILVTVHIGDETGIANLYALRSETVRALEAVDERATQIRANSRAT